MASYRKEKIERQIQRIVGDALLKEIKDPRIGFASVTRVKLNKDNSVAKVYISVLGGFNKQQKTLKGLISSKNYIQYLVGKGLQIRNTPRLVFEIDDSIEKGVEMVDLLESVSSQNHQDDEADE